MIHETRTARLAIVAVWVVVACGIVALVAGSAWIGWIALGVAMVVATAATAFIHTRAVADGRAQLARARARRARRAQRRGDADHAQQGVQTAAIEAIATPVLATDPTGRIVWSTPRARGELVPEAEVGRRLDEVLAHADLLAMHEAAARGAVQQRTLTLATASARAIYEVAAMPIVLDSVRDATPMGVVLTFQDITELAQTVQLKSDFVANASHELRTPVASITAALETLEDLDNEHEAMRPRLMAIVRSNARRLGELLDDLLELSRLESAAGHGQPRVMDVASVVVSVEETLAERIARRQLRIAVEQPEPIALCAPPGLVALVVRNLLDNATRFAKTSTTIRVVVEPSTEPLDGSPRGVRVSVIDRGIGIPLAEQARVFERFYQIDPSHSSTDEPAERGTGLGLAIVKHAVRAMGGRVGLESVWQQGTTVWFELPGADGPSPQQPDGPTATGR